MLIHIKCSCHRPHIISNHWNTTVAAHPCKYRGEGQEIRELPNRKAGKQTSAKRVGATIFLVNRKFFVEMYSFAFLKPESGLQLNLWPSKTSSSKQPLEGAHSERWQKSRTSKDKTFIVGFLGGKNQDKNHLCHQSRWKRGYNIQICTMYNVQCTIFKYVQSQITVCFQKQKTTHRWSLRTMTSTSRCLKEKFSP